MKTFSQASPDQAPRYAASETLKNELDHLLQEHLTTGDPRVTIDGQDELITRLEKLIQAEKLKQRIAVVEAAKGNLYGFLTETYQK